MIFFWTILGIFSVLMIGSHFVAKWLMLMRHMDEISGIENGLVQGSSRHEVEGGLQLVRVMMAIEELRMDECDSVLIYADNADFEGPQCAIECCGFWTDFKEVRFTGDTIQAALEAAVAAKRAAAHA